MVKDQSYLNDYSRLPPLPSFSLLLLISKVGLQPFLAPLCMYKDLLLHRRQQLLMLAENRLTYTHTYMHFHVHTHAHTHAHRAIQRTCKHTATHTQIQHHAYDSSHAYCREWEESRGDERVKGGERGKEGKDPGGKMRHVRLIKLEYSRITMTMKKNSPPLCSSLNLYSNFL